MKQSLSRLYRFFQTRATTGLLILTIAASAFIGCGNWLTRVLFGEEEAPWCLLTQFHYVLCAYVGQRETPVSRPICPTLCFRGYCQNGVWLRDNSSPTCGRAGASGCETCGVNSFSLGLDALQSSDVNGPGITSLTPAAGMIGNTDAIKLEVSETLAIDGVTVTGSLTDNGHQHAILNGQGLRTTVEIAPVKTWPTGQQSLSIAGLDEVGNSSTFNFSYYVRDYNAELQAAAAAIQAKAASAGAVLTSDTTRIGTSVAFYSYAVREGWTAIIYTSPAGAYIVYGEIFLSYSGMGLHSSWLGMPISDEYDCNIFFRCSNFVNGYIIWDMWSGSMARGY